MKLKPQILTENVLFLRVVYRPVVILTICLFLISCSSDEESRCDCAKEPDRWCESVAANGEIELNYGYTPEDVIALVEGQWTGTYPGDRAPAFDVEFTISIPEPVEVYYGIAVHKDGPEYLTQDDIDECASMSIAADIHISHEDVAGVGFDLHRNTLRISGFELAQAPFDSNLSDVGYPTGFPLVTCQNYINDNWREGDDDVVTFLLSSDYTFWMMDRQIPWLESGTKVN